MAYRNPRRMSSSELYSSLEDMRDQARAVQRSFQRARGSLYYAAYEDIAARNRQTYGQAILPKELPTTREGMEEYFRRAQQILNLESVPEARRRVKEMAQQFADTVEVKTGQKIDLGRFGKQAQKNLSEFLHSDEWKRVYGFGSARAMKLLADTLAKVNIKGADSVDKLKEAFENFSATNEDLKVENG